MSKNNIIENYWNIYYLIKRYQASLIRTYEQYFTPHSAIHNSVVGLKIQDVCSFWTGFQGSAVIIT